MGTDIYHALSYNGMADDALRERNNAIDTTYAEICAMDAYEDACDAANCSGDCRCNDEPTRNAVLELSRRHPEVTFALYTRWACEDDPEEYVYFRGGRAQVSPVVKVAALPDIARMAEPQACPNCGQVWDCEYNCTNTEKYTRKAAPTIAPKEPPAGYEFIG